MIDPLPQVGEGELLPEGLSELHAEEYHAIYARQDKLSVIIRLRPNNTINQIIVSNHPHDDMLQPRNKDNYTNVDMTKNWIIGL